MTGLRPSFDRRRTPVRDDLAAESLRGEVAAPRFAPGRPMRIAAMLADLRESPSPAAALSTQALHGEGARVFDEADGWAWCQLERDDYVGYLAAADLSEPRGEPTHRVAAVRTFIYPSASIKAPIAAALPMGAKVRARAAKGEFLEVENGFVYAPHVLECGRFEADFVAVAERFLNAPYLWGGKSWLGLDCSGLIQLALGQAGLAAPRDCDMMLAELGEPIDWAEAPDRLERGDLVFWKGHVGVMQDASRILHANGHHMMVVSEPLTAAADRIARAGAGSIAGVKRTSGGLRA